MRRALGAMSVVAAYMTVRSLVYRAFPATDDFAWFRRDVWMTAPRLAALAASWALYRRWFPGPDGPSCKRLFALDAPVLLVLWGFFFSSHDGASWPWFHRGIGFFTSMAVGFFEEFAFRGIVLGSLLRVLSPLPALLWSSLAFTAFHWQAQPFSEWPHIFLTGFILGEWRLRGDSLLALAIIHGLVDALYFFFGRGGVGWTPSLAFLAGLGYYSIRLEIERRGAEAVHA